MTVEYVDGIKVMRLRDCHGDGATDGADIAMMRLWLMISGGHSLRDGAVFNRRF